MHPLLHQFIKGGSDFLHIDFFNFEQLIQTCGFDSVSSQKTCTDKAVGGADAYADFKSKLIPFLTETFLFENFSQKDLCEILDFHKF